MDKPTIGELIDRKKYEKPTREISNSGKWDYIWENLKKIPYGKELSIYMDDKADAQRIRVSMQRRPERENLPFVIRTRLESETKKCPLCDTEIEDENSSYVFYLWKEENK